MAGRRRSPHNPPRPEAPPVEPVSPSVNTGGDFIGNLDPEDIAEIVFPPETLIVSPAPPVTEGE